MSHERERRKERAGGKEGRSVIHHAYMVFCAFGAGRRGFFLGTSDRAGGEDCRFGPSCHEVSFCHERERGGPDIIQRISVLSSPTRSKTWVEGPRCRRACPPSGAHASLDRFAFSTALVHAFLTALVPFRAVSANGDMADKDAEEGRTTPFNAAVRFDPIKAKVALHESTPSASEPSTRKRASFVPDTLEKRRQEEGRAEEDAEEDAEDDAEAGLVKMPPVSDHTFYILLRQPKGGISGKNALQRLAAKLTSRFDRVDHFGNIVQSDTVVIKASRSEPYLVDNGKNGKHYLVLTAQTPAKNSEKVAEAIRSWPEVIGLQRLYALETMLFHAFADVYDVSEGRCIPVPSRGSGKKLSLSHAPNPAISLDALEQMVSRLDLGLSSAQVRASFGANAHATAPRLSWHSVALHVTRCLRPNRHIIENALAVLDASSSSSSSSSPAGAQQGTATTDQLRTTLLTLSDKLGLDAASIAAVVHRAQVMSEGSKRIDYKRFLANVCSGLEATASPPPHALAARQQMARKLEGNRSREVAKLIADDWKALDEKERAKFEELAAKDYKRYCREKHTELKAAKRRMGQVDGAEDEGVTEHELPRWGVGSEVKPPRSAFSFFSSNELARFGSDDSFNKLFRVPTANSGGAGGGNGVTSSEPGGASFQRLMNFKGFCAWFAALPLPVKAGLSQ
jgi:hypothetical protein